ncbi:MAG TPA: S46 family peptidase [Minicystis sp.]|nr:S46 family peptidase [Minicystis sp.]
MRTPRSIAPAVVAALTLAACAPEEVQPPPPQAPTAAAPTAEPTAAAQPPAPEPNPDSDEGMWLLNDFPSQRVAKKYGFAPTQPWLDHVRLSSVRLALGCSGSIVSPSGLVMTNHHCASQCISQISSAKKDYQKDGFFAKTEKDEVKCPGMEVDELTDISDVTDRVNGATKGLADKAFNDAQKAEMSKIEKACATSDDVRCDVVTLYHGGKFHLYKYKRFQDVRLVFAPEFAIAFFGGDPDNFMFPRYDLDVSFLRIYDHDKPAQMANYFEWSKEGVKPGDLTFVSGHPGSTSRLLTTAQLAFQRDVALPSALLRHSELRGALTEFGARGKEERRISSETLFGIENAIKARKGMREALIDPAFFGQKVAEEKALRARVEADPALKDAAGAWDAIANAQKTLANIYDRYVFVERGAGFQSDLFGIARELVRAGDEMKQPNEQRLREYTDSHMPAVKAQLFSNAPIYDEFETFMLTQSLTKLREVLGADDPFVKKVLGKQSPAELAAAVVKGTKLKDVKVRKALFAGGKAAIDASKDPMIQLARLVDPDARGVRKQYEDSVESVEKKNGELIAKAEFAVYGTSRYPDATFTLRLAYGSVKGWNEAGHEVNPITTFAGAFDRATGRDPFALPKSWLDAKSKLNLNTPFDFCATNDIIGGNSGSPVVDKNARIVGLIFDGNIHSLGGDYGYDPATNRAVAVHSAALVEALDKVYGAQRLLGELKMK